MKYAVTTFTDDKSVKLLAFQEGSLLPVLTISFDTAQACQDYIEANLPGVSVTWTLVPRTLVPK